MITEKYKPKNIVRILTAASLFDGHDVAINIMRRIMQSNGAEVIHLGHNISAKYIVESAVQEDVQAIALTSYQGGHIEFFKYIYDLLKEKKAEHIKIFGGGGGTILPEEINELQNYGISRIYSPDDGRILGLQGMINDVIQKADYPTGNIKSFDFEMLKKQDFKTIAETISAVENFQKEIKSDLDKLKKMPELQKVPVIGITGTGGAGKSTIIDEIVRRFLSYYPDKTMAIISVDPSKRKTGGALLGDRIRMNSIDNPRIFMRSLATREANVSLSKNIQDVLNVVKYAGFDLVILESSGIGQSQTEIVDFSDLKMYVMTPEYGSPIQLEKIDMIDFADIIAINKFDKIGSLDALKHVKKQYQRNHELWDKNIDDMPVYGTIASHFNDKGVNELFNHLIIKTNKLHKKNFDVPEIYDSSIETTTYIIPPTRKNYLAEISHEIHKYNKEANEQSQIARKLFSINNTLVILKQNQVSNTAIEETLKEQYSQIEQKLNAENLKVIKNWETTKKCYTDDEFTYSVRNKKFSIETKIETLSHSKIPKVAVPRYEDWGEIVKWTMQENFPGVFPFTAGVFPFKREEEEPTRMFAGEGGPERTNKRFHYVSQNMMAKRLSTAFDSVTLYGEDPDMRPDIYGKIGNSGVSICCLDDAKKLYSGFRLTDEKTSVSMTINGPAPIMLAYFFNAATDQECEIYIKEHGLEQQVQQKIDEIYKSKKLERPLYKGELPEGHNGLGLMLLGVTGDQVLSSDIYEKIKQDTISKVRGTVQADILKEDQAQNTCIFSTEFSLKLMGDVQEYFIQNNVRNFYSVSISGYHIAEAGANPVTQLAFTLANAFTYVEYYLARGMNINEFAPNFSFFFSNGEDAEYSVIGRVARRIWSKAMKIKYNANDRSQKLKYHIQTSGRSLHAQEIAFNDIRTTLQALYAIFDNCNSLHTNAYDEAITTPTEESVRRALAIQMVINNELGLAKNQNPWQGSFIVEELTDLVEDAVLKEFESISERGGVLGAAETMYQRNKIQEESLYYETLKHNGKLPIIGVNTFLDSKGSPTVLPEEVIRATEEEKKYQIYTVEHLHKRNKDLLTKKLHDLKTAALNNQNIFESLMDAAKYCSIGQITGALYEVGGQYRRNM